MVTAILYFSSYVENSYDSSRKKLINVGCNYGKYTIYVLCNLKLFILSVDSRNK